MDIYVICVFAYYLAIMCTNVSCNWKEQVENVYAALLLVKRLGKCLYERPALMLNDTLTLFLALQEQKVGILKHPYCKSAVSALRDAQLEIHSTWEVWS